MQIRQLPLRRRGRDAALADQSQAHAGGPVRGERDDAAWGDGTTRRGATSGRWRCGARCPHGRCTWWSR
jgi:hypothetical protein